MTKAATSKTSVPFASSASRTRIANSIEATPLGPNQAMNAFCGRGRPVPTKESETAIERATSRAKRMKRTSAPIEASYPVATMTAPKTKKVSTWKIVLRFSEKSAKRSVISCSEKPSVIPAT